MMLSSLPLHLLQDGPVHPATRKANTQISWNCVLLSTIPVTDYQVALVANDFQQDFQPWNNTWITHGQY
jgi:hypothetical protein